MLLLRKIVTFAEKRNFGKKNQPKFVTKSYDFLKITFLQNQPKFVTKSYDFLKITFLQNLPSFTYLWVWFF